VTSERITVALLAVAAGLASATVFAPAGIMVPVTAAAFGAFAVDVVATRLSRVALLTVAASVVGYFVVIAAVVFRSSAFVHVLPTAATVRDVTGVVRTGWRDLLAVRLPAPASPAFLAVPFTITWAAAAAGLLLLRTRWRFVPAIPAVAALVLMVLLGDHASGQVLPQLACLVVFVAMLGVLRGTASGTTRTRMTAALVAAGIACGSTIAGAAMPGIDRRATPQLRDLVHPEVRPREAISPLTALGTDAIDLDMSATLHGTSGHVRIPFVALDDYDGVRWSVSGTYSRTGAVLPADGEGPADGPRVRQSYEVRSSSLPWLPAMDRPLRLDIAPDTPVGVDPVSDELAAGAEVRFPLTYEVVSALPREKSDLRDASVGTTPAAERAKEQEATSVRLSALAAELTEGAKSPFDQMARIAAFLRDDRRINQGAHFTVDPKATAGFAAHQIERFLADDPHARTGPPKLFVAAFATLLRELRFPCRIVIGLDLADVKDGIRDDLTEAALTAWPEVDFAGHGWVAVDPLPHRSGAVPTDVLEIALNTSVTEATTTSRSEQPQASNPPPSQGPLDPPPGSRVPWLFLAIVAAGLGGALATPLVTRYWRRWQRRHASLPAAAVLGAWHEAARRVAAGGTRPAGAYTVSAAVNSAERFGPDAVTALSRLGEQVNAACFGRHGATTATALEAWTAEGEFRRSVSWRAQRRRQPLVQASADSAGSGPLTSRTTTQ
jgi:transglutaminase-like putative cysteine protease